MDDFVTEKDGTIVRKQETDIKKNTRRFRKRANIFVGI